MAGEVVIKVYTVGQLGDGASAGTSGASKIGLVPVEGLTAAQVQQAVEELAAVLGQGNVPDAGASQKGASRLSAAPASPTNPVAVGDNDARMAKMPTAQENDALAGTHGAPGASNRYVTDLDPRFTAAGIGLFRAQPSAQQTNLPNGATTKLNFASQIDDPAGWYDAPNSRYAPLKAGWYWVGGAVRIANLTVGGEYQLYVLRDGAQNRSLSTVRAADTAGWLTISGHALVFANGASHYFELGLHNGSGAGTVDTETGIEQTYFEGHFVAA